MGLRQTTHLLSARKCADFTAAVVWASTDRVDTLPALHVLMVTTDEDGRRALIRAAVLGAPRECR